MSEPIPDGPPFVIGQDVHMVDMEQLSVEQLTAAGWHLAGTMVDDGLQIVGTFSRGVLGGVNYGQDFRAPLDGAPWLIPHHTSETPPERRDIVDEIDALVDEQLANYGNRSGYDYNVNQDKCPHCKRHWHGLPITERIANMYSRGTYDEDYRVGSDDSRVLCEGSEFIGPMPAPPDYPQRTLSDFVRAYSGTPLERHERLVRQVFESVSIITGMPPFFSQGSEATP